MHYPQTTALDKAGGRYQQDPHPHSTRDPAHLHQAPNTQILCRAPRPQAPKKKKKIPFPYTLPDPRTQGRGFKASAALADWAAGACKCQHLALLLPGGLWVPCLLLFEDRDRGCVSWWGHPACPCPWCRQHPSCSWALLLSQSPCAPVGLAARWGLHPTGAPSTHVPSVGSGCCRILGSACPRGSSRPSLRGCRATWKI